MLSDRDLASLDVTRVLAGDGAEALLLELSTPVQEVMASDVVSVEAETPLGDVIALFLEHKIGALPVVEPDTSAVIGIVSYIDVLRALQDLLEEED
jgi:CBS domain-containing protein